MVNPAYARPSESGGRPSLRVLRGARMTPDHAASFAQVPTAVLRNARLSLGARATYGILKSYAWQDASCFPDEVTIAQDLGVSDRRLRDYIAELEAAALIAVTRRGRGHNNLYTFCEVSSGERPDNPLGPYDRKPASDHIGNDRKNISAQDSDERNRASGQTKQVAHDRKLSVPYDRKPASAPLKEDEDSSDEYRDTTGVVCAGAPQRTALQEKVPRQKRETPTGRPTGADLLVDELRVALGCATLGGATRRKWADLLRPLLTGCTAEERTRFVGWLVSNGYWTKDTVYRLTKELEAECEAWLAAGKPVAKQQPARRDRGSTGREPPKPPPTEVPMIVLCFQCKTMEGWPHDPHCSRKGRVSPDNLVSREEFDRGHK